MSNEQKKILWCPPYERHDRVYDGRYWNQGHTQEYLQFHCERCGKSVVVRFPEETHSQSGSHFVDEWGTY